MTNEYPSLITSTLEGRVKLAYANGLTDDQIASQENIPIAEVVAILSSSRLPIRITGITIDDAPILLTVYRKKNIE